MGHLYQISVKIDSKIQYLIRDNAFDNVTHFTQAAFGWRVL